MVDFPACHSFNFRRTFLKHPPFVPKILRDNFATFCKNQMLHEYLLILLPLQKKTANVYRYEYISPMDHIRVFVFEKTQDGRNMSFCTDKILAAWVCKLEFLFGCFRKWWYPQIIHFNRVFHYKPSILGYPYFWKHPFVPWKLAHFLGSQETKSLNFFSS